MSKKVLILLAEEISRIGNPGSRLDAHNAVARVAAYVNPLFDAAKFYKACGL